MEYLAKTSLPLYIFGIILPCRYSASSPIWYNLHSYIVCQRGEKVRRAYISLTKYSFLAIHAKGGESISPKQKDRTTTNFKKCSLSICIKEVFSIGILFDINSNWYDLFQN
jgi:hypothetical protein